MSLFTVRPAAARGVTKNDWLDSRHSFSFGSYHDQNHEGFRTLRVINEDRVLPDNGFATHGHRNMEIITYVMDGALSHRDDIGNHGIIRPGEIQRMSAGRGILHSEFNASKEKPVHFLQVWINPAVRDGDADYRQKIINPFNVKDKFGLLASRNGQDESLPILQEANIWLAMLSAGRTAEFTLQNGRGGWVQLAKGAATANGQEFAAGDGASWTAAESVKFTAQTDSEILLFDLA